MHSDCKNCHIKKNINSYKILLDDALTNNINDIQSSSLVDYNNSLENLLFKCITCKNKLKNIHRMNSETFFGCHPSFYYYGYSHLIFNLCMYVSASIANNELVYISMEEHLYISLLEKLEQNNINCSNISFSPVKNLIDVHKSKGLNGLRKTVEEFNEKALTENFNGIRWIGQPTYAIKTTSKRDFLNWEQDLSKALMDTRVSLICIYDYYDFMHEGKVIDEEVIKDSFNTHSFIFSNSALNKGC